MLGLSVPDQLEVFGLALQAAGGTRLNVGYRYKSRVIRTGYRMGEATVWVEVPPTRGEGWSERARRRVYYRGADLLTWLVTDADKKIFAEVANKLDKVAVPA